MYLLIGLGNPGDEYIKTRHNIGFRVIESLVKQYEGTWKKEKKCKGDISHIEIEGKKVLCLKPDTFMNNSGKAVKACMNYYDIDISHIIIISDDKDMDFGKIRVRKEGGSGGHNGIISIIQHLSTEDFTRLKIGIKNELVDTMDTADFVLSRFSKEEEKEIPFLLEKVIHTLCTVL